MTNNTLLTIDEGASLTNQLIDQTLLRATDCFREMTAHLSKAKGKGIRTQLLLGASMLPEGTVRYAAAKAAAAVELLHMATLVHDDIIDNAPIRRGIETLHERFGKKEAVICGDYLLCLAMNLVSDLVVEDYKKYGKLQSNMTKALSKICEGELAQHSQSKNLSLSVYDYMKIISGKTASLFYISAYSGAIISDCREEDAKKISRFGKYLGLMFQMMDDCKDFEMSQQQVKKPVKNDVAEGVVTLPLILALRKNKELIKPVTQIMTDSEISKNHADFSAKITLLIKEVINTGSVKDTKEIVARYRKKAESALEGLESQAKKQYLISIPDLFISL